MSSVGYSVKVNNKGFAQLKALTVQCCEKSIKAFGTIYANAMASATPPHTAKGTPATATKGHADIKKLKQIISLNIAGVEDPRQIKPTAKPVPYRKLAGAWMAIDPETKKPIKTRSPFGFIVPTSWRRVRGQNPPETDPAAVYATARWRGKKMVPAKFKKVFVRKNKLAALVKKQQKEAGKLISGWAHGARVFATGKRIAPGFFAELGGKGWARIFKDKKGQARAIMVNRQAYNERQSKLIISRMPYVVKRTKAARAVQVKAIVEWYVKQSQKALK